MPIVDDPCTITPGTLRAVGGEMLQSQGAQRGDERLRTERERIGQKHSVDGLIAKSAGFDR